MPQAHFVCFFASLSLVFVLLIFYNFILWNVSSAGKATLNENHTMNSHTKYRIFRFGFDSILNVPVLIGFCPSTKAEMHYLIDTWDLGRHRHNYKPAASAFVIWKAARTDISVALSGRAAEKNHSQPIGWVCSIVDRLKPIFTFGWWM